MSDKERSANAVHPAISEQGIDRRTFLRRSALALGGLAVAGGPLQALMAGSARQTASGYGPLFEAADEITGLPLIRLPRGFRYISFGWTGDPLSDGTPTPALHDGMDIVATQRGRVVLVRNHEVGLGTPFGDSAITYDPLAGGGTTNLVFNLREGQWEGPAVASLTGTIRNCAGGGTPWGSWLTCEENLSTTASATHGWVFESSASAQASPVPLTAMGRFNHEAVAVDRKTGIVYETEDRGTAGFYRFLPNVPGQLSQGGQLQMLKVVGVQQADLTGSVGVGSTFPVEWVDIPFPERLNSPGTTDTLGVFMQGFERGGAVFKRLEGCWPAGRRILFVSTSGGDLGEGQVWEYRTSKQRLRLIYESPAEATLDNPDNITVSPRGGILLCEDGDLVGQRLIGLTQEGDAFPFAQNNIVLNGEKNGIVGDFRDKEWAGACFSRDGEWLFVNIQTPGITFAITGPWNKNVL